MNTLKQIEKFQTKALIEGETALHGTSRNFGYHIEEIIEMLDATVGMSLEAGSLLSDAKKALKQVANHAKAGTMMFSIADRCEFLDALADQVVTATAVAVNAKMDLPSAVDEVHYSNLSKLFNDEFIRDEAGKIVKPITYLKPNLNGLY